MASRIIQKFKMRFKKFEIEHDFQCFYQKKLLLLHLCIDATREHKKYLTFYEDCGGEEESRKCESEHS